MEPATILSHLRALVLVVDGDGEIEDARGGHGGFFGHDLEAFPGTSVFDYVSPDDVDGLATYFIDAAETSFETASLPVPFRLDMRDADGTARPLDVIATGVDRGGDAWTWIVLLVPLALSPSVIRPLEAEMAGASRGRVKELLTEEFAVDNEHYTSRCFLIELPDGARPIVSTSRVEDQELVEAITSEVSERGWRPWGGLAGGDTSPLSVEDLADPLRSLVRARGWRRASVTPVQVDGAVVAAYLLLGRVPEDYDPTVVTAIIRDHFRRLVDVTALLTARWRDQDRLVAAATRDPLTGLANRDAFADELADAGDRAVVLYVDIDHFKPINDEHGHDVGDRVLVEVAERIVNACRPTDVIARFGGDEFVVLLTDVDEETATSIGERILSLVEAPLTTTGDVERVTVSVGLAAAGDHRHVVDTADRAMLQAKRFGRGRMSVADQGGPAT